MTDVYYKLAKPDGFDFFTGKTINYRENIGKLVSPPHPNPNAKMCSDGLIYASRNPNDCLQGAKIPCSVYRVAGKPVIEEMTKAGFIEFQVVEEITTDFDTLFGWRDFAII